MWVSFGQKDSWGIQLTTYVHLVLEIFSVCGVTLHDPVCLHGMLLYTEYVKELGTPIAWQKNTR